MITDNENNAYYFDLKEIMKFVNAANNEFSETEITDAYTYDDEGSVALPTSKIVRDLKNKGDNQMANIRYDLLKNLINEILAFEADNEKTPVAVPFTAINTLEKYNMLKKTE